MISYKMAIFFIVLAFGQGFFIGARYGFKRFMDRLEELSAAYRKSDDAGAHRPGGVCE